MDIKSYLSEKRRIIEGALQTCILTPTTELTTHIESLNYSLKAGGKRVRPILCLAAVEALGKDIMPFLPVCCALECIHTYSLIHDDLPAMDNDELRRGKPTNHMIYGEAGAILAGDGLLSFAFELLSKPELSEVVSDNARLRIIHTISQAVGSLGMVGGQALDIDSEEKVVSFSTLQMIHRCKTGALITASVQTGAVLAGANSDEYKSLTEYGDKVGLAFQIVDDLLNVVGTTELLGKTAGSDAARNKATYPAFFGVEKTRLMAQETVEAAKNALREFDQKADPLRSLADYIYSRTH
nr:polyprenyl synthetase family protein [Desulfobulbaceae bacterium]